MSHPGYPDILLEIFGNELGAVVGNNPRSGFRVLLPGTLKNDFNICFGHLLPYLPMDNSATATVQEAAQVIESPMDVEIRDVHMPVFMRAQWLNKTGSFQGCLFVPLLQQTGFGENTPGT